MLPKTPSKSKCDQSPLKTEMLPKPPSNSDCYIIHPQNQYVTEATLKMQVLPCYRMLLKSSSKSKFYCCDPQNSNVAEATPKIQMLLKPPQNPNVTKAPSKSKCQTNTVATNIGSVEIYSWVSCTDLIYSLERFSGRAGQGLQVSQQAKLSICDGL
jgi:hypothetical protein